MFNSEFGEDSGGGCSWASAIGEDNSEIPTALRERALEAVERIYQRTVRDLGHAEADAQIWTSAVMLRLRSHVAQREVVPCPS